MTKHNSNADLMTAWQTPAGQLPLDRAIARCPGCGNPAHASETDDAGYHPACARIPNGTLVRLDDGTIATAYRDRDGTYRTSQSNPVTRGTRIDLGWRREQLTVVTPVQTGGAS